MDIDKAANTKELDFALWIRRLLLMIVKAIEIRYNIC